MSLLGDLRYAARSLSNSPVFSTVAILSLTLGIGANGSVATTLNGAAVCSAVSSRALVESE
jgi:hypothetical protein